MKAACTLSLATAILLGGFAATSLAQQNDTPALSGAVPAQGNAVHPDAERGTTGWTGGAKQPGTDKEKGLSSSGSPSSGPDAAENQPWMATGVDLNGPPTRFPANKTPE